MFASSTLNRKSKEFFENNQYFLIDSAYVSVNHFVFFYKNSIVFVFNNKRFNRKFFSIRIDIEHAFDMLKNRWRNLIEFRFCLYNEKQYEYMIQWIIVCVIFHNIFLDLIDVWDVNENWWIEKKKRTWREFVDNCNETNANKLE